MLMTYDASVEVMNKKKLFPSEHTVHNSALRTQQKPTCQFYYRFTHWRSTHSVCIWWQTGSRGKTGERLGQYYIIWKLVGKSGDKIC